jgi:uncharacterized lipoprotein NlpE involved in copper resistance
MNKKITALTVTALASFALLGCNSDSDNDTESSNEYWRYFNSNCQWND